MKIESEKEIVIIKLFKKYDTMIMFIFAFALMYTFLNNVPSMISESGDATETWIVAKTYFLQTPTTSYVMYKGFLAMFINVIFYQMALFFNVGEFTFVKIFNSICFAYIATIGAPYLFKHLGMQIKKYKIVLFTIILFFVIRMNFRQINVDVPSITMLILSITMLIHLTQNSVKFLFPKYLLLGMYIAVTAGFSGQYVVGVLAIALFFISALWSKKAEFQFKQIVRVLVCLVFFLIGFSLFKGLDNHFVETRVQPVRDAGGWLPDSKTWAQYALTRDMTLLQYNPSIIDNRGTAILTLENANFEAIAMGGGTYPIPEYIKIVMKYPLDFIARWCERLFLGISSNILFSVSKSVVLLASIYSLLFICLETLKNKVKSAKQLFAKNTWLVLGLILPSLVPCLLHVEARYFMSIQLLIVGIGIFETYFWDNIEAFLLSIKNREKFSSTIDYGAVLSYAIFILLCFVAFSGLNEIVGPVSEVLYKLW